MIRDCGSVKFSCAFSGGTPKPRSHRLPVGPRLGRLDHLQPILPALEFLRQLRAHPIRTMLGVLRRIGGCRLAQQLAIQQAEKLHPGYGSYVEYGVSIPWARMNNMLGCAAARRRGPSRCAVSGSSCCRPRAAITTSLVIR